MLADLKMPGSLEALDPILQGVDGGAVTAAEAIESLLDAQIQLRNNRRLQAAAHPGCPPWQPWKPPWRRDTRHPG